ncbi:MAG: 2Fe-2S iron-sulfur cluster binding domain-containing protein [Sphingobacteriaceae bacterium]|nr:MAG: 2Fe-2S iron-sulfur cluster binding domain-containing protein [Sphingobacteriaceae bacterium]
MVNYTLKIVEIRWETGDTVTLCFKQPGLKKVKYFPGQYVTLNFRINGRKYSRPYSFSSSPDLDQTLNVTVKRVPGGVISNHIADCLKVGDTIEVVEPMGDFTLQNKNIKPDNCLILWAAGSGITPLISIAKYALHHQLVKHITLVYGNRDVAYTIFSNQILLLQKQYPDSFKVWNFHTKAFISLNNPDVIEGRIAPEKVLAVIRQENDIVDSFHYICGPAGLKESVQSALKEVNVPSNQIFTEEFNLVINPQKFDGIITRKVLIKRASSIYSIEVTKGKTILEAGLDALIDLPYSCQTGSCLLCKARLIAGKLKSVNENENNIALMENEHLLCCSLPLTDDIEIAVD